MAGPVIYPPFNQSYLNNTFFLGQGGYTKAILPFARARDMYEIVPGGGRPTGAVLGGAGHVPIIRGRRRGAIAALGF